MATDTPDALENFLQQVRAGGSAYPEDWTRVITLSSRLSPHQINRDAFRKFQTALSEVTGLRIDVVGAKFGCTHIFVELNLPDPNRPDATVGIRTNHPNVTSADLKEMFIAAMKHNQRLRELATAAGLDFAEAGMRIDLTTGESRASVPQEILFNVSSTRLVRTAPAPKDKRDEAEDRDDRPSR